MFKSQNFPTILTLIRLIFSPLVLPLLFVYLLPLNIFWLNSVLAILFVLLSLTDFFDGYLARKYDQVTTLGGVLDHLADKFLTYSALIALLAAHKIYFYWVVLLIGREFFIMGLRHVALENNFTVPVSLFGKMKTMVMMICITFIVFNPAQKLGFKAMNWNGVEIALLALTLFLSIFSAQQYYNEFIRRYRERRETHSLENEHDQF